MLASRKGYEWIYVGSFGTGLSGNDASWLRTTPELAQHQEAGMKRKNLVVAQPTLITEIEFHGRTEDGGLRHAAHHGLRELRDNAAVFNMAKCEG